MSDRPQLASLLLEDGLITEDQLDDALALQQGSGQSLGRVLVDRGVISEVDLVRTLARQIGLDFVDLDDYAVDSSVSSLIPEAVAKRHQALPIGWEDGRLVVAMANPSDVFAIDDIRALTGADLKTVVVTSSQLAKSLDRLVELDSDADAVAQIAAEEFEDDTDLSKLSAIVEDAPIVKFVNLLIMQAVQERASDIHVEPAEKDLRIRYRIDGVLHEVMRSPRSIQPGVISRLKVMADINIAERRIPQDGRVSLTVAGKTIDLRVATLPTVFGEKVVMRILDKSTALLTLEDLGFLPEVAERYHSAYSKPWGTILVTGPTGSGKSTTLYATLNVVNDEAKNVITVEDPVEYRLPGINQVQVNKKAGMTFAAALRSILRSDPDIVLVGEIRDEETAVIAIEAALTGHLVFSTLHTNDATSTPLRLLEMGVEPFLVTSALDCVLAQRLARRLCDRCKEQYAPSEPELLTAGLSPDDAASPGDFTLFKPVGCAVCAKTGYKGRFAIHEVMLMSEEIERAIVEQRSSEDLRKIATSQGMLTLRQDGLRKVLQGQTALEELARVVS
ncbi:MAG TPA: ATPase, T2SS/T4P/T4SS family [Acidimicrobiia bacterium]|nr:ATPase, T2SS/T4P/T4SS family [Acidimicrobiia bacterium]